MTFHSLRHTRPLLAVIMAALLLAGCGQGSSPTSPTETASGSDQLTPLDESGRSDDGTPASTIAPGEPNPEMPVSSVEGLVATLVETGLEATYQGQALQNSFFFPDEHLITVNGQDVRLYAYDTVDELIADARKISPDAGMLDGTPVRWMEAPRFYARSTFIALYVGVDTEIIEALQVIFGAPFAGQGASATDVVIDPGIGDGSGGSGSSSSDTPGMQNPALIVVGNDEQRQRLAAILPEEEMADKLYAVDLSQYWIVAVFRGAMPTAGYDIEIEAFRLDAEGQVIVEVSLETPGATELVAQVITYPIDVRIVAREGLTDPSDVVWLAQTAEGRELASFAAGVSSSSEDPGVLTPVGEPSIDPIPSEPADSSEPDEPFRLADIRGTITESESYEEGNTAGILVRILVEGPGTDDTVYDRAWVEIVASTQISFDGETFAPLSLKDLAPGQQVQITFTGPVRESYPVQAVAGEVMVLR
ncbi:MAG TPA: protease complex subunit PrcB family protein [Candidatus Latescibacteria bacterium]|jgi:hypothetical protein|nr:protease complex subunit PrcB family protein [Candidatus Latescibacterota bacterium]HJP29093.1 protease complex subunit PrcB family protein [Candidatus Latescibacterota bacterium]